MAILRDVETRAAAAAIRTKEHVCRRSPHDISAAVDIWRGNELVAVALPDQHERSAILDLFAYAAAGFDADAMAIVMESYVACVDLQDLDRDSPEAEAAVLRANTNPMTGALWALGEMADAVKHHDAIEKGWIEEAIVVSCANRAGDITLKLLPFRYAGKHLVWKAERHLPDNGTAEGYFADRMTKAMNAPSLSVAFNLPQGELSREERDIEVAKEIMRLVPCRVALRGWQLND